uniref:DUF4160 domain-containing protein n=1 Tax=Candidatus Kentrum sp. SD TaxID=2126332 RepID=A0A450Y8Y6_9GAMM|nr:MAG: protein of unknown function (DUF4160) [Candidatus Kentron sp. SD]VFK42612.1 MAG: protein of unknown function (DUF4160) [Candidatus Kentron sp. SD]
MPFISRFFGIIIAMYWGDHCPPHFHAKYGDYEITVNIFTGIIKGRFPKRTLRNERYDMSSNAMSYTRMN